MPANSGDSTSFFDQERERLSREISSGFEDLLSTTNDMNRKLEEVLGMTKEYENIASLWQTFYQLMSHSQSWQQDDGETQDSPGIPGTGGHTVATGSKQ